MRCIVAILLALLAPITAHAQSTFAAQIHNAPGWAPSTTYTYSPGPPTAPFTRVVAGPGWSPSDENKPGAPGLRWLEALTGKSGRARGTWHPGLPLNAYQLTSAGMCTSASGGSGPSGTGTNITDGTCTWKYLSVVDYISITGWALDNGSVWAPGTDYGLRHVVNTGPNSSVYQQLAAGCHSTVQPTGTAAEITTADGCIWDYKGNIYYSSRSHPFPHDAFYWDTFKGYISGTTLIITAAPATRALKPTGLQILSNAAMGSNTGRMNGDGDTHSGTFVTGGSGTRWTVSISQTVGSAGNPVTFYLAERGRGAIVYNDLYHAQLWNDREYVSGQNGELSPILIWNHNHYYNDSIQPGGYDVPYPASTAGSAPNGAAFGFPFYIEPAPGEGFADTFATNPTLRLAGYNANNGVAIRGVGVPGLSILDNRIVFEGLQVTSDGEAAIAVSAHAGNDNVFERNILQSGTAATWVTNCGFACWWIDNLIIANSTIGIAANYGGFLLNNTFACPSGPCESAMSNTIDWINVYGMTISGNAVFGFQHFTSSNYYGGQWSPLECTWNCSTVEGTNNVTDVPASDGASFPATTFLNRGIVEHVLPFQTGARHTGSSGVKPVCGHLIGSTPVAGTCEIKNNVLPSEAFVSWPSNLKINPAGPLIGAGASINSTWNWCTTSLSRPASGPGSFPGCWIQADTPDLLGTTRPQSSRYDTGAVEFAREGATMGGGRLPQ